MKRLGIILGLVIILASCEYPISEINEWWKEGVLHSAEETATVIIELDWGDDER